MKRRFIAIGALCFSCFACGNGGAESATPEDVEGNLLAGKFEFGDDLLPDCSPLLGQLQGEEAEPGVNCIERRLYWWLGATKSKFRAAAVINIGDDVVEKQLSFTDAWDTPCSPTNAGFLVDSKVETVIYGEIPPEPLLSCYWYGTPSDGSTPICSGGPGAEGEYWYVYKGRALAFFGDDCILQTYDGSCASIYRLYPIRDDMVIDYDGSTFSLKDALNLINDHDDEWKGTTPVTGYSLCPEGLRFLNE